MFFFITSLGAILLFCDSHSLVKQSITGHSQDISLHQSIYPEFSLHLKQGFNFRYIIMLPIMVFTN